MGKFIYFGFAAEQEKQVMSVFLKQTLFLAFAFATLEPFTFTAPENSVRCMEN